MEELLLCAGEYLTTNIHLIAACVQGTLRLGALNQHTTAWDSGKKKTWAEELEHNFLKV